MYSIIVFLCLFQRFIVFEDTAAQQFTTVMSHNADNPVKAHRRNK